MREWSTPRSLIQAETECVDEQRNAFRADSFMGIEIQPIRLQRFLSLKSWADGASAQVLAFGGTTLPDAVGVVVSGNCGRLLCVGPIEWNFISLQAEEVPIESASGMACVDLTDAFAGFEVKGALAAQLLAKGCALDFHIRSFPLISCARTRFFGMAALICKTDDATFEIFVSSSFAAHLYECLLDASTEWRYHN